MNETDACGERGSGPHVGLDIVESIFEEGLPDRLQEPSICGADAIGDRGIERAHSRIARAGVQ